MGADLRSSQVVNQNDWKHLPADSAAVTRFGIVVYHPLDGFIFAEKFRWNGRGSL